MTADDDDLPMGPLLVCCRPYLELPPLARHELQIWGASAIAESGRADQAPVTIHAPPARPQ